MPQTSTDAGMKVEGRLQPSVGFISVEVKSVAEPRKFYEALAGALDMELVYEGKGYKVWGNSEFHLIIAEEKGSRLTRGRPTEKATKGVTDNLVDTIPQKEKEFYELMDRTERAIKGEWTGDIVVDSFAYLVRRRGIPKDWVNAFLWSMESDLVKSSYRTLGELSAYLYGSAEVIGLMMAKILGLPKESYEAAMYQGRAMQYINFIRDISEDLSLGRTYFPTEDLEEFGLPDLKYSTARDLPENFRGLVRKELAHYCKWQRKAEKGYRFIPKRYLIPIKSAADMYNWTAAQISRDPFAVYRKKIRPSTARIFATASYNTLYLNIKQKSRIKKEAMMSRRQMPR